MSTSSTGSVPVHLPAETVFAVLTDYNAYAQWMPRVSHSRTLASEGDIVLAEFVWPAVLEEMSVLEFIHSPPHTVAFTQTNGSRRRRFSGRFEIAVAPERGGVVLSGKLRLKTAWYEGWFLRRKLRTLLAEVLAAAAERAQTVASRPTTLRPTDRVKILEVRRSGNAVRVWLLGDVYMLKRTPEEGS